MSIPEPIRLSLDSWKALENSKLSNRQIFNTNNYQKLHQVIEKRWQTPHGDSKRWQQCIDSLPPNHNNIQINIGDTIRVSSTPTHTHLPHQSIKEKLLGLSPWRKGPFQIFQTYIDSEWQSDWKWQRIIENQLEDVFKNANVFDIGCGNGYYGWRMLEAGAQSIIGIDGSLLLHYQFAVCKQYDPLSPLMLFPLRFDLFPQEIKDFDVVVSMGVLSHTKDPFQHLIECKKRLKKKGKLILETLIINSPKQEVLKPQKRYAKMNNVFALPSPSILTKWLDEAGFNDINIHDITRTTPQEQKPSEWMGNQSLQDFLDPQDTSKTIEGYPAPTRLMLSATNSP